MDLFSATKTVVLASLLALGSFIPNYEESAFTFFSKQNIIGKEDNLAISLKALFSRKKNDFVTISQKTKEALVNIVCIPHSSSLWGISGSGVIIDERGVILTNAHIGQYFILENYPKENSITCEIKTGNPARTTYRAKLLFIPPEWVSKHAKTVRDPNPIATGENDYALLLITNSASPSSLPFSFPFLKINLKEDNALESEVLAAGYPASIIGGISLPRDLYAVSSVVKINKVQSFNGINKDFFLLSPSAVAERGSSGGAVVNKKNELISLIVSVKNTGKTFQNELGTITLSHINRGVEKDTGLSLSEYLNRNLHALSLDFTKKNLPGLTKEYQKALSPCSHLAILVPCPLN